MRGLNIIRLVGLSVISMLIASCLLGAALGGVWGFIGGPLLMLFGWFFLPVVIGMHFIGWVIFPRLSRLAHPKLIFCAAGCVFAAVLFAAIGPKEEGRAIYFACSYAFAAGTSACLSCLMIARFRKGGE